MRVKPEEIEDIVIRTMPSNLSDQEFYQNSESDVPREPSPPPINSLIDPRFIQGHPLYGQPRQGRKWRWHNEVMFRLRLVWRALKGESDY